MGRGGREGTGHGGGRRRHAATPGPGRALTCHGLSPPGAVEPARRDLVVGHGRARGEGRGGEREEGASGSGPSALTGARGPGPAAPSFRPSSASAAGRSAPRPLPLPGARCRRRHAGSAGRSGAVGWQAVRGSGDTEGVLRALRPQTVLWPCGSTDASLLLFSPAAQSSAIGRRRRQRSGRGSSSSRPPGGARGGRTESESGGRGRSAVRPRLAPKVTPPVYFHRDRNSNEEHNNTV